MGVASATTQSADCEAKAVPLILEPSAPPFFVGSAHLRKRGDNHSLTGVSEPAANLFQSGRRNLRGSYFVPIVQHQTVSVSP